MDQTYKGKLLRIIDADTIEAAIFLGFNVSIKKRIRLIGINAPEIRTKDPNIKQKGLDAKAFLESLFKSKDLIIKSIAISGLLLAKKTNVSISSGVALSSDWEGAPRPKKCLSLVL